MYNYLLMLAFVASSFILPGKGTVSFFKRQCKSLYGKTCIWAI